MTEENAKSTAPVHAVVSRIWVVRIDVRYDYDQECSGVLRCFTTKVAAETFIEELQEHWSEFRETWYLTSNRWGEQFYLSMSPQGFEGVTAEEWAVHSG
jgi:hypothetical protein